MAYERHQQMLAEVKETVANIKKDAGLSSKASVRADFLKEDPKSFETESMSYVQVAAEIIEENEELFALSRLCDRFVPQYLKICKTLEKTIEYLGSVCLTKSAMKYYGKDVSLINHLTIEHLNQMLSFNFRKVKAALDEKKNTLHEFDLDLYNQMLSFAKVMQRLRVTENRALDIKLGLEEPRQQIKNITNFSKSESASAAPLRELPSYPIHYEAIENDKRCQESGAGNQGPVGRGQDSLGSGQETVVSDQKPVVSGQKPVVSVKNSMLNVQDKVLTRQEIERQAKFNVLNDEEKELYAEAVERPDIVTEMRSKLRNVGYCCLHEAEIRSIRKILAVIDSG